MGRSYQDAVRLLRSRLRRAKKGPWKNHPNCLNMKEWLSELGYEELDRLNVIHITGTKGKGSTAAFTECLLRAHFERRNQPIRVGLYTSPHLITETERIRVNFHPLSEEVFARHFFYVWDRLLDNVNDEDKMPGYLQLLTLVSIHAFHKEHVDVAIYEVHAGGRKDATNIFDHPIASGFTTIGLDHADLLGDSIQSIAKHKSGIMKKGCPAYSVQQEEDDAKKELEGEASRIGCPLKFVDILPGLPDHPMLQLLPQRWNLSLAIHLANAYLTTSEDGIGAADIADALGTYTWPGRFQMLSAGDVRWFLDVAHNSLSLPIALSWFQSQLQLIDVHPDKARPRQLLLFGHESARDTKGLIQAVTEFCDHKGLRFDAIILSPYKRYGLEVHRSTEEIKNKDFWLERQPTSQIICASSLQEAMSIVNREESLALVTGSTHLVGEVLSLLQVR